MAGQSTSQSSYHGTLGGYEMFNFQKAPKTGQTVGGEAPLHLEGPPKHPGATHTPKMTDFQTKN